MTDPDPQLVELAQELKTADAADKPDLREQMFTRYLELVRGGNTAGGLPYPDPDDPWFEGADAIRALAEAIDTRTPFAQAAGVVTFPTAGVGATETVVVTLPAGRFTVAPAVQITAQSSVPRVRAVSVSGISTTRFTAYYSNTGTAAAAISASWSAIQMTSTSISLLAEPVGAADDAVVTCPTEGCENRGVTIVVPTQWTDEDGNAHPIDEVVCGVCGTVLTPVEEES